MCPTITLDTRLGSNTVEISEGLITSIFSVEKTFLLNINLNVEIPAVFKTTKLVFFKHLIQHM